MPSLSEGVLEKMLRGEAVQNPILQVLSLKRIENNTGTTRYRVILNDGINSTASALLSTQKNEVAARGELNTYAVIEVSDFVCNTVQNRRLIILLDFTIIRNGDEVQTEIGTPRAIDHMTVDGGASNGGHAEEGHGGAANGQRNVTPPVLRDSLPGANAGAGAGQKSVAISHQATGNGSLARTGTGMLPANVFPLQSITPYQNKWCIRARVTKKNPIKTYSNSRGEGKLFSCDLADESGEMRATGFNQECDKFYEFLKEGGVYYIKGGQIKSANKQYSSINNDYELTFNSETQIEPCYDEHVYQLPTVTFNFLKFEKLPVAPKDRVIDVIGVVDSFSQCQTIISKKTNSELKKRDIRLVDDSCNSVSLTLWGETAEKFEPEGHPVMAVKGVRISDFNGISLSAVQGFQMHLNPDVPEAHRMRGWYDSKGDDAQVKSLTTSGGGGQGGGGSGFIPIALAEVDRLGTGDKPDNYSVKGFVASVKRENCLYKACPSEDCNKKLVDQGTGRHRCERCNKEFDSFKWRLLLQVNISDFSGVQPVTLFNEQAEHLVGMSAQDLADLRERDDQEFNATLDKILFKQYAFRLRAKMDRYNDEERMKVMCNRTDDLNMVDYCKFMTDEIRKMGTLPDPNS